MDSGLLYARKTCLLSTCLSQHNCTLAGSDARSPALAGDITHASLCMLYLPPLCLASVDHQLFLPVFIHPFVNLVQKLFALEIKQNGTDPGDNLVFGPVWTLSDLTSTWCRVFNKVLRHVNINLGRMSHDLLLICRSPKG